MNHEQYMIRAIALAKEGNSTKGGGAFGVVIVKNGNIVAEGYNRVGGDTDLTQHAELRVIQMACKALQSKDLSECILYTSCEPCMMCLGSCYWAGFKSIYYGASAEDAKKYGYVYSDMFYASDKEKRYKEFNMHQLLSEEAVSGWL